MSLNQLHVALDGKAKVEVVHYGNALPWEDMDEFRRVGHVRQFVVFAEHDLALTIFSSRTRSSEASWYSLWAFSSSAGESASTSTKNLSFSSDYAIKSIELASSDILAMLQNVIVWIIEHPSG